MDLMGSLFPVDSWTYLATNWGHALASSLKNLKLGLLENHGHLVVTPTTCFTLHTAHRLQVVQTAISGPLVYEHLPLFLCFGKNKPLIAWIL